MRFAHSRRSQQDDVLSIRDERQGAQLFDQPLVHTGLKGKIKLLQGSQKRQSGLFETAGTALVIPRHDFDAQ
ncbi:hypothetical protein DEMA109039_22720 [Deinococcus marmoris]